MLRTFFQKLFGRRKETREPYEFMQEFSDETTQEYIIQKLQNKIEVLEEYHFFSHEDKEEAVTCLTVEENGKQREVTFPGAIPESYFPQLFRQKVRLSIKESASYDPGVDFMGGCKWRCTQDHVLNVLTGELASQQFKGRKYWLDDYPLVVTRVKNQPTQAVA